MGAYIVGNLTVSTGTTLEGISGAAGSETEADADSIGVRVDGNLTVSGGTLTGNAGTATASERSLSAGISAGDVTVSGGSLTGSGSTSKADYALSYGMCTKVLNISGGTATATGSSSQGVNTGSFSAGVASNGGLTVSGGSLAAQGGAATVTGTSAAQSSGIYAEADSISFTGGTVKATGGESGYSSLGICNSGVKNASREYVSGGAIAVSDTADVTAIGGTASDSSYGLWCRGTGLGISGGTLTATGGNGSEYSVGVCASGDTSKINVSGGKLTAMSGSATNTFALNKTLSLWEIVAAIGSAASNGSNSKPYVGADNGKYRWVFATDSPTLIAEANPAGAVAMGTSVVLSATPVNIPNPSCQWYSNATDSTSGANAIKDATSNTYAPPTNTAGTIYYYCKAASSTLPDTEAYSNIVAVTVSQPSSYSGGDYTPSPVTVYNDPSVPNATVWLTGSRLTAGDQLITERNPSGASLSRRFLQVF